MKVFGLGFSLMGSRNQGAWNLEVLFFIEGGCTKSNELIVAFGRG
jgi:hypothetical protein